MKYLPSMHKPCAPTPVPHKTSMVSQSCKPRIWEVESRWSDIQGNSCGFEANVGYTSPCLKQSHKQEPLQPSANQIISNTQIVHGKNKQKEGELKENLKHAIQEKFK